MALNNSASMEILRDILEGRHATVENLNVAGAQRVPPTTLLGNSNDGIKLGRRYFDLDINEQDVIRVKVTMAHGEVGELTINATTLVQIIMDRNYVKKEEVAQESDQVEIQVGDEVGDGDDSLSRSTAQLRPIVTDEELLRASARIKEVERIRNSRMGKIP